MSRARASNRLDLAPERRCHAAERLAVTVLSILDCPFDPKTVTAWGRHTGVAPGTLRVWCKTAHVRPKAALDFGRLLRAVLLAQPGSNWELQDLLDVVDGRTIDSLLVRGGLSAASPTVSPPTVETFLSRQLFVQGSSNIDAIRRGLARAGLTDKRPQPT